MTHRRLSLPLQPVEDALPHRGRYAGHFHQLLLAGFLHCGHRAEVSGKRPATPRSDAVDVVGTGGDSSGTYNISTASGLVVAGCGVPVAEPGTRGISSKWCAAEVLAALVRDRRPVYVDLTEERFAGSSLRLTGMRWLWVGPFQRVGWTG